MTSETAGDWPPGVLCLLRKGPYVVSSDSNGEWYPRGPGTGFGYHGGYLFPHTRFPDQIHTEAVTVCMNSAYHEGYRAAQRDIRQALGLEKSR